MADVFDAKSRSLEIQEQIADLFPSEYTTRNELRGPDSETPELLIKCKPMLSDEYWNSKDEPEAVQYTGGFAVRLDEGAPVETIVEQIYQDIINSPEINIDKENAPEDFKLDTVFYTTDGYEIMLSYVLPSNRNRYTVDVYVWSPCFIPETMPPGREI